MKGYVDVFLLPVPKKHLRDYKAMAQVFAKVVADLGALEYREWVGDDLKAPWCTQYPKLLKIKPGEVVIASVVEYRSKAHRDQVNKKLMKDPRLQKMHEKKPIFDMKKMCYGGFSTLVKM